ncbi:MAG: DUF2232 domain-containing protein [Longimicrobiales bacterium]|nr:DUF2232 domain-containing protein [Longimicrobiales bacterium]
MSRDRDRGEAGVPEEVHGREWVRALGLGLVLLSGGVAGPFPLVAVPFLLLVVFLPVRRRFVLLLGLLVALRLAIPVGGGGLWYVERGWAVLAGGWFVALTLVAPSLRLSHRVLATVGGAGVSAGLALAFQPGWWGVIDWQVRQRVLEGMGQALALLGEVTRGGEVARELEASVLRSVEVQAALFPAILGLTTAAGLALAWWGYCRLAVNRHGALGPVRNFRFEDQLVWVFIAGLLMVVLALGEGWTRAGSNTLVFMGALYALRGFGVLLFLSGGLTLLGGVLVTLGMLFMAPVLLAAATLVGLGDTWLDIRARAGSPAR